MAVGIDEREGSQFRRHVVGETAIDQAGAEKTRVMTPIVTAAPGCAAAGRSLGVTSNKAPRNDRLIALPSADGIPARQRMQAAIVWCVFAFDDKKYDGAVFGRNSAARFARQIMHRRNLPGQFGRA